MPQTPLLRKLKDIARVGRGHLTAVLRPKVSGLPLVPLEEFGYPWASAPNFKPAMEAMLAGRWEKAGYVVTDMRPPINFDGHTRPHACDLHSWEPVGYALRAYEVFADERYLQLSCGFIFDWLDRYWKPVSSSTAPAHLDAVLADTANFAWYDMAVGRRIFRIAYVLDVLARDPHSDDRRMRDLWAALQFHHAVLSRAHFFRAHNNHGLYQALGQLAAARRFYYMPESAAQFALARERLLQILDTHFTSEGVHREHSPGYQYGVLASLVGASAAGLIADLEDRIQAMECVLSWMILPSGRIAPLGDTDPKPMNRSVEFASRLKDEGLRYQLSSGVLGTAPATGVKRLLESGYAFARLPAAGAQNNPAHHAYLAQSAAFHSTTHKQADHLTFVWYDGGRDIVTDSGRYGYVGRTPVDSALFKQGFWYSDPKRIYVESTRAHNCVVIDGKDYPRRGANLFGSALTDAREEAGLAIFESEVRHFRTVRHRRNLVLKPGHFLLVLDWLFDRSGAPHDYVQHFTLAPAWDAVVDSGLVRAQHPGSIGVEETGIARLEMCAAAALPGTTLLPVVRGQEEPQMLGWISDAAHTLVPASVLRAAARADKPHTFAMLFSLSDTLAIDRNRTRCNASATAGQIAWRDAHGRSVLRFSPHPEREAVGFALEHTEADAEAEVV